MACISSVLKRFFFLTFTLVYLIQARGQAAKHYFNVTKYGAVGDAETDNTKAFNAAWKGACQSNGGTSVVLVPSGTFVVGPIVFIGPCKGPIEFQIQGILKAKTDKASLYLDHWISFQYINGLKIYGGGSLDGQGPSAWPYNTCLKNPNCPALPVSMRFDFVTNSWVRDVTSINSKNFHFSVFACKNLTFANIRISAPGDSPNTDGIHIGDSTNISVSNSDIGTGDDCVSMLPGSENISITHVRCGPGHGISIGSLGRSPDEKAVQGVTVTSCNFSGTTNGVRIKTWAPSYPGKIYNLTFQDIHVNNVSNPILIDQNYCPANKCSKQAASSVQISDVKYRNIWGTSSTQVAVSLLCSKSRPCQQINLTDININYNGAGGAATSSCANAHGAAYGKQQPRSCL